ncbi:MAG: acyl-CoA-binding protein [Crocosphaera sp.]|nr:acyl-CoA-binding protein [Crocosphaera sp.]
MLTLKEINHFQEKGWVGPLDIFESSKLTDAKNCLETYSRLIVEADGQEIMGFYNNVFNLETPRDLHLFHQPIANLFQDLDLVKRVQQIAGNDLLLWYTNVFCKLPGQGEIKWHQAKEYYTSSDIDYQKKTLVYDANEDSINLTVWVALDDADLENGCMQFANGSHQKIFPMLPASIPAKEGVFAGISAHKTVWQREQKYSLSYDFNENDWPLETVPIKAGQAIIFTEKVMHRSFPNRSNRRRLAIIGRYVRPSTQVYPYRWQGNFIDENGHNIQRHYCLLVSGEDKYGHNLIRQGHDLNDLELQFQTCLNQVKFEQVEIPEDKQKLDIYALEKQAIEGDCQESEPNPILHPRKYIQWSTWNQYRGMSNQEAMEEYIQLVGNLSRKNSHQSSNNEIKSTSTRANTSSEIETWLIAYLAELLEIDEEEIDITSSFQSYGLSSAEGVGMIGDLSDWLGNHLNPALMYEYPNIDTLSEKLAQKKLI